MNQKRVSSSNILAKECIVSALIMLTREKPLTSISICELCTKAGVSRMTFYRNYESKEDIFIKHLSEIFEAYKEDDAIQNSSGTYCDRAHMVHFFNYIYQHHAFLDALMNCGFDVIFLNMLNNYILEKWKAKSGRLVLTAFAGALYNMFRLWSASGYEEDKEELVSSLVAIYNR